jgi:transcriptional antiterminator RfaH
LKTWYLVHTKPRQEQTARLNLERQGYGVYLPLAKVLRRRGARRVATLGPLFPRYLFVALDLANDNAAPIRSTVGVSALVRFGQEVTPVPEKLVAALHEREAPDGVHHWASQQVAPGERVRIAAGKLQGYEGIFLARSGRERATVLIELLGGAVRATVEAEHLESAG